MSKIVHEEIHQMQNRISITLEKADYADDYDKELKKYRERGNFKGFRKGKVPIGFVRKMVGREVLVGVLERKFMNELNTFLEKDEAANPRMFQPIPAPDQTTFDDLDVVNPGSYTLAFDVGRYPEFEMKGVSHDYTFTKWVAEVTDEMIDKRIEEGQERLAESKEVDDEIRLEDLLRVEARELENGEPKQDGHHTEFFVAVDMIASEALRDELIGQKSGYTFRFDIYNLERDATPEHTQKHLLNLSPEEAETVGNDFEGTIKSVNRKVPAELNADFFNKYFRNAGISTLEDAQSYVREDLQKQYNSLSLSTLFFELRDHILEHNPFDFPEEFFRRYLLITQEEVNEENVDEEVSNLMDQMQWHLLREKLITQLGITVSDDDVREQYKAQVIGYFGGNTEQLGEGMLDGLVDRFMQDANNAMELRSNITSERLVERLPSLFAIEEKEISVEELEAKIEQQRMQLTGEEAKTSPSETPEEEEE